MLDRLKQFPLSTVKTHSNYLTVAVDHQQARRKLQNVSFAGSENENNAGLAVGIQAQVENTASAENGGKENENSEEVLLTGEQITTRKRMAASVEGTCFLLV